MSIKPYKSKFGDGRSATPPISPGGRRVYLITHVIARLGPPGYEASSKSVYTNFLSALRILKSDDLQENPTNRILVLVRGMAVNIMVPRHQWDNSVPASTFLPA